MWIPRFASAFRRRLRADRFSPAALAAMARSPSYRAPSAADLRDELAAQPPAPDAPLEDWGAKDIVIRDGKVIGCSLSGRAFIAMGNSKAHPSQRVGIRLVAVQPFMEELARCPHLANLHRLDLTGNRIGVNGARALAASPFLSGLRELILSGNQLGDAGVAAIGEAPWFANLKVLELADNGLHFDPAAPAIHPCLRVGLHELNLSNNPLNSKVRLPAGLVRLSLSRCGLVAASWPKLSECFESLEELDVSFNAINFHDPWGLSPRLLSIRRFNIGFNEIEDTGVESLADAEFTFLESLDLSANRITEHGAFAMAESSAFASLRELNLSANAIGDAGALALMRSEALGNLGDLNLANCGITDAGVQKLAVSESLGGLQRLSLAWNAIGDGSVRALAACPDLAGLRELDLTGTHLGFAGAIALVESPHLANLLTINLGDNNRLPPDAVALLRERYTMSA